MTVMNAMFARMDRMFEMATAMDRDLSVHKPGSIGAAQELRGAVSRCLLCSQAQTCAKLLATESHLVSAPDYCRNKDFLQDLPTR